MTGNPQEISMESKTSYPGRSEEPENGALQMETPRFGTEKLGFQKTSESNEGILKKK